MCCRNRNAALKIAPPHLHAPCQRAHPRCGGIRGTKERCWRQQTSLGGGQRPTVTSPDLAGGGPTNRLPPQQSRSKPSPERCSLPTFFSLPNYNTIIFCRCPATQYHQGFPFSLLQPSHKRKTFSKDLLYKSHGNSNTPESECAFVTRDVTDETEGRTVIDQERRNGREFNMVTPSPRLRLITATAIELFISSIITCHLADAFIQSDLQLIRLSRRHTHWSNVGLRVCLKGPTAVQILSWPHQGSNHRPCGSKSSRLTATLQAALSLPVLAPRSVPRLSFTRYDNSKVWVSSTTHNFYDQPTSTVEIRVLKSSN